MNIVREIHRINERELQLGTHGTSASWHEQFRTSAYVFVSNLDYELTEGDILTVFSQFGEIVDLDLVRDRQTGRSKGFCFLAYEDQRSTDLAVDNFNGMELCGRTIRVDHTNNYVKKSTKEQVEKKDDNEAAADEDKRGKEEEKKEDVFATQKLLAAHLCGAIPPDQSSLHRKPTSSVAATATRTKANTVGRTDEHVDRRRRRSRSLSSSSSNSSSGDDDDDRRRSKRRRRHHHHSRRRSISPSLSPRQEQGDDDRRTVSRREHTRRDRRDVAGDRRSSRRSSPSPSPSPRHHHRHYDGRREDERDDARRRGDDGARHSHKYDRDRRTYRDGDDDHHERRREVRPGSSSRY